MKGESLQRVKEKSRRKFPGFAEAEKIVNLYLEELISKLNKVLTMVFFSLKTEEEKKNLISFKSPNPTSNFEPGSD